MRQAAFSLLPQSEPMEMKWSGITFERWQFTRAVWLHLALFASLTASLLVWRAFVDKGAARDTDLFYFVVMLLLFLARLAASYFQDQAPELSRRLVTYLFLFACVVSAVYQPWDITRQAGSAPPISVWLSWLTSYASAEIIVALVAVTFPVPGVAYFAVAVIRVTAVAYSLMITAPAPAAELQDVQYVVAGSMGFSLVISIVIFFWMTSISHSEFHMLRAQPEMASYLFHELRNDLHALGSVLEFIDEEVEVGQATLGEASVSMMRDARLHATHASDVIRNMLELGTSN